MSLFVNPAQFGPDEDLEGLPAGRGPRTELAEAEASTWSTRRATEEVYPRGLRDLGRGRRRPHRGARGRSGGSAARHFRGVATVVAKLLNTVGPEVAFFGQKDAQQALVIRRMVRDLDFPVEDRGPADRSRTGRARDQLPQRLPGPPGPIAAAAALEPRACAPRAAVAERGRRRPRRRSPPHGAELARGGDRARVPGGPRRRDASTPAAELQRAAGAGRRRGADRSGPPDRQHRDRAWAIRARRGMALTRSRTGQSDPAASARDAPATRRDEAPRRADRDGHRLRLPLRPRSPRRPVSTSCWSATPPRWSCSATRRRPRSSMDEMVDHGGRGPPRPPHAAAGRRPAVRLLRALQRARDRQRAAVRQGGRLRRGEAGARRRLGRAGAGDRPLRDPGHGPRRPDPPDRQRPRRLQDPGAPRSRRCRSPRTRSRFRRRAASRSSSRRCRLRSRERSCRGSRCR